MKTLHIEKKAIFYNNEKGDAHVTSAAIFLIFT